MRTAPIVAALLLPAPLAAGSGWCDEDHSSSWRQERHCEVREISLSAAAGRLAIDAAPNGGVSVEGWDRDEVEVLAKVVTSAEDAETARAMAARIRIEDGGVIRADGPSTGRDEHWSVSYRARVPRDYDLRLDSHNGGIAVEGVSGRIEVETHNGGIRLVELAGDVRGRTRNGGLRVELAGDRWAGAGLDLETRNGGVKLLVPEGYNARLITGTVNGGLRFDFPVEVRGDLRSELDVELGEGGPPVRVTTHNGGVTLSTR